MEEVKRKRLTKALSTVTNVLVYVFCAFCLLLLTFTVFGKRNADGAVELLGYEVRIVLSGSMEKNDGVDVSDYKIKDIKTGSMVLVRCVPQSEAKAEEFYSNLKVGDVLTFRYDVTDKQFAEKNAPQMTITHRITDIQCKDTGGYIITLRGDNSTKGLADVQIIDTSNEASPNYVVGQVVGKSFVLGRIIYSLKRPLGIALLIIVPCAILVVWNVVKIVNVLRVKKEKAFV